MDFLKKLNTLVQAQINDIISPLRDEDAATQKAGRRFLARQEVAAGLAGDVVTLRKRVNEALDYEGQLQAKVDALYARISELDTLADQALRAGQDDEARNALGRLHQAQREVTLLEADLREHRHVTQTLLSQVNTLEAVVEQAQQERAQAAPPPATPPAAEAPRPPARIPVEIEPEDDDGSGGDIARDLAQKIDSTRQKLSELIASTTGASLRQNTDLVDEVPPPAKPVHPMDQKAVDEDMARRISRLSRPDAGEKS